MPVVRVVGVVLLAVVGAVVYGVIHDQVTARICVEYFTIGHESIGTDDPTKLGFYWGVVATWWVGLPIGVLLAVAARAGPWPKVSPTGLVAPMTVMLVAVGGFAAAAGWGGHAAAVHHRVFLLSPLREQVPPDRHVAFLTDGFAHFASYLGGAFGGLSLCAWVVYRRSRAALSKK